METTQIFQLGIGLQEPWNVVAQNLDLEKNPHELHIEVKADRGAKYPCPECGVRCLAHDFRKRTWRHLNFFQHHCYIHAAVPRTKCLEHGVKITPVPWARKGSSFTLLFEQAVLALAKEMPVLALSRLADTSDNNIWRIIQHYVDEAKNEMDLSDVEAVGMDETSSKKGHNYVSVFVDMEKQEESVVYATEGKDKSTVERFKNFMEEHNGSSEQVKEAVCDMSPAFISGISDFFINAEITVDWFHVVKHFVKSVDDVRKKERKKKNLPAHIRWAILKNPANKKLTENQIQALIELESGDYDTAIAWKVKEKLSWIREAKSIQGARWRLTRFINYAREKIGVNDIFESLNKSLNMLENQMERIVRRWESTYTNAKLEGLNSIFQAVKARARGYRNTDTFITMIYLLASPVASLLKST